MTTVQTRTEAGFQEERIDGTTIQTANPGFEEEGSAAKDFAWGLYDQILKMFATIVPLALKNVRAAGKNQERSLKESLSKLILWGDGFRDGRLERILSQSDDLRENVVDLLAAVGRTLISKLVPVCEGVALPSKRQEIREHVQELNILLDKRQPLTENTYDSDGTSGLDPEDALDNDLYLAAIGFLGKCMECLMEIVPSMEDALSLAGQIHQDDQGSPPLAFQVSDPARSYVLKEYRPQMNSTSSVNDAGDTDFRDTETRLDPAPQAITFIVATDFGTRFSSVAFKKCQPGRLPWSQDTIQSISNYPDDPMTGGKKSFVVPTESWYANNAVAGNLATKVTSDSLDDQFLKDLYDTSDNEKDQTFQALRSGHKDTPATDDVCSVSTESMQTFFWGYATQTKLLSPDFDQCRFTRISRLKVLLDATNTTSFARDNLRPILKKLKKSRAIKKDEDIITDYLTQLFLHTKEQLTTLHGFSSSSPLEHVLCVPNIWSPKACRIMQASTEIAIRESGLGTMENLFLVSENEAAAAFVLDCNGEVNPGEAFVILDAGAGTVEATTYTVHQKYPLRLKCEAVAPNGGLYGSSYLNEAFREHLQARLEEENYLEDRGWTIERIINIAMLDFENRTKRKLDLTDPTLSIEGIVVQGLRPNTQKRFKNHCIIMARNDYMEIFRPLLRGIEKLMKEQLTSASEAGIRVQKVVLIGGFAGSPTLRGYLTHQLKDFSSNRIQLIDSDNPETLVARGAILRALDKKNGPTRVTRSSYGFLRTEPFDSTAYLAHVGIRPSLDKVDGIYYVRNTIDWLIKKGDRLPPRKEIVIDVYHTFTTSANLFLCEEVLYVSDTSIESHYRKSHRKNHGAEVAGKIIADMTFLKTDGHIKPIQPKEGYKGKPYYKIEFQLCMIIDGRHLKYEARWPAGGAVQQSGQISIAAAFEPGTN
ncbi:related to hsp70 protein [Phialocephala subalpina]|uniref:Related to hsp70 protein n=1 Tax=Phialocephala subalpina TaxID=576137 RepID=A0A1L7X6V4_9HELO|nr:related to hsp70 protein [Phialocephala subalpina]